MESVVAQIVVIIQHFWEPEKLHKHRLVREELIDKTLPWGYFDGASQDRQLSCGGGRFLFKSESFHFSVGLGRGSNNYAELMTLRLLDRKSVV